MAEDDPYRPEIDRLRRLLRLYVERSVLSRAAVAEKAGLSEEEVEEVLEDKPLSPYLGHIYDVLRALGTEPRDFFAEYYGFTPSQQEDGEATQ